MIYILSRDFNNHLFIYAKDYFIKNNIPYEHYHVPSKIDKSVMTKQEIKNFQNQIDNDNKLILSKIKKDDILICWGWKRGNIFQKKCKNILILEHGYIFNRNEWISIGWNGLNGRADFLTDSVASDRWKNIFKPHVKPWQYDGKYILLCGQVPGDASLKGKNLNKWYTTIAEKAYKYYNIPVVWRPHPVAVNAGKVVNVPNTILDTNERLQDSLNLAKAVITYNSNAGVEAIMNGVPVISKDQGSMYAEIATPYIGKLKYPNRDEWGRKIAYSQWHTSEIKKGIAFNHIFQKLF